MDREFLALLYEIQQAEFVAVELNLFLDTHPGDQAALEDYNTTVARLKELKDDYVQRYGPLSNFGTDKSKCPWQWVEQPWPWENGA
ncbi:MAG: spore coat protein CotJB [Bacillota bacterium]